MTPITAYKVPLSEEAEAALSPILAGAWPVIKRQIVEGVCEILTDKKGGWLVTRVEVIPEYQTLVIVAGTGFDMVNALKVFKGYCQQEGIKYIRCHAARPGVWKLYERAGMKVESRVYILECDKSA